MVKKINVDQICATFWAGICSLLLILVFFFSKGQFGCKRVFLSPFLLSLISMLGIALLYFVLRRVTIPFGFPVVLGICAHLFQFWLVKQYFFLSGWDCGTLFNIALNSSEGNVNDVFNVVYLSAYPNNLLIAALMTKAFTLADIYSWDVNQLYALFHSILCLLSFLTGVLTFRLAERITGRRSVAFLTYILFLLLIGASPWVSIPYSDSVCLIFPILLLSLYSVKPGSGKGKAFKWFFLGFLAYLGYSFKPTASFPFIAIIVLELVSSLEWSKMKKVLIRMGIASLGILAAYGLITSIITDFGCEIDPNLRFGPVHFFCMGLNERTNGIYSQEDADFAASFETVEERNAGEFLRAKERIRSMGVKGLLRHGTRKLLSSFYDGSFAWGVEGNFFSVIFDTTDKAALLIRSFYYKDGEHFSLFMNFMQAIWLSVLILGLFAAGAHPNRNLSVCLLTCMGLVLYLLLFEIRARYVYIFAPVFLVEACCGITNIENHLLHRKLSVPDNRSDAG